MGTDSTGRTLLKRIRARVDSGYEVIGFLGISEDVLLAVIDHQIPVLGIIDDLENIVKTHRIHEVIFSPGAASYERILDVVVSNKVSASRGYCTRRGECLRGFPTAPTTTFRWWILITGFFQRRMYFLKGCLILWCHCRH